MPDLQRLLSPRSVAVIGASPNPDILRGRLMKVMTCHDYKGQIFPISRSHDEIAGFKAWRSISEVPETVDLAVVVIPAEYVPDTLIECGEAGVGAAHIITSGFAEETGEAGADSQRRICEIAERYDMAVCGPNSQGFANTLIDLCPTFSPGMDNPEDSLVPAWRKDGMIAVIAQSGGVGFSFYDRGRWAKELPFSYVVTTGNEAHLQVIDFIEYMLDEGRTDAFILFMEDIKTPERLAPVAEKALRAGKPLIIVKIGRTEAGVRAAASHTAAMAGSHAAYRAMFDRYGIIEGDDIEQIVDIAAGFSYWGDRLPAGQRVGIATGSGGGGGWMADRCMLEGLEVPVLDDETRAHIDAHLPSYGTSQNPVDGTAQAIREVGYARLASMVGSSPEVDAVITITSARHGITFTREKENLEQLARESDKPMFFCSYTLPQQGALRVLAEAGLPLYTNMPNCARVVGEMARYRAHRERFLKIPVLSSSPIGIQTTGGTQPDGAASKETATKAAAEAARLLEAAPTPVLCEYEAAPVLAAYGLPVAAMHLVHSAEEAVAAAETLGGPVALKVQSPDVLHKTEAGAVALGLRGAAAVRASFEQVTQNVRRHAPKADIRGVLVQPMAHDGVPVILGINRDRDFGPMLMAGSGGILVEVMRDVAFAPMPLGPEEARALLDRLRGRRLLDGVRGAGPADVTALIEAMVGLSRLAGDHAQVIREIDLNPVIVHPEGKGISIVDALILRDDDRDDGAGETKSGNSKDKDVKNRAAAGQSSAANGKQLEDTQ